MKYESNPFTKSSTNENNVCLILKNNNLLLYMT